MELETAVERLYTDESLAADVDDRTAGPLLKWAESVLPVLIARGDEGFEDAFITFKKLIKSVARLIDMRGEIDMTERAERAEKIQGFAQELGIPVNVDHLETLASFDGPELVAQMVGGTTAFTAPPPTPEAADETQKVAQGDGGQAPATPNALQTVQPISDSGLPIEPQPGETPLITGTPEDIAEVHTGQTDAPAELHGSQTAPQEHPAVLDDAFTITHEQPTAIDDASSVMHEQPATAPSEEQPAETAEKPSLFDGIGAFFQRVADQMDDKKTDHPDDKE